MTEQQYRVHTCGNTEPHDAHTFRGTYQKRSLPGVQITETFQCEGIERPVPTTDITWRLRNEPPEADTADEAADVIEKLRSDQRPSAPTRTYPFKDGETVVLGPGVFAAEDGSVLSWGGENYVPQPSVPTREQIAEALRESDPEGAAEVVDFYYPMADAVLALIQNGADHGLSDQEKSDANQSRSAER